MAFEAAKVSGPCHCLSCRVNYLSHEVSCLKQDLSDLSNILSSCLTSLESKYTFISEELASQCPVLNSTTSHHPDSSISPPQLSRQPSSSPKHPKCPQQRKGSSTLLFLMSLRLWRARPGCSVSTMTSSVFLQFFLSF